MQQHHQTYSKDARVFTGWQDRIDIIESEQDVVVSDEFGIKIIYEESLNDLV